MSQGGLRHKYQIKKWEAVACPCREVDCPHILDDYLIFTGNLVDVDEDAEYFVLRIDKDPHARAALMAYIISVEDENGVLAGDLKDWLIKTSTSTGAQKVREIDAAT